MKRKRKERRRKRKLPKWAVAAKYVVLTVAGVIAFLALSKYAAGVRGYRATGGEMFCLLLPVLCYLVKRTVTDVVETIAGSWREERW